MTIGIFLTLVGLGITGVGSVVTITAYIVYNRVALRMLGENIKRLELEQKEQWRAIHRQDK